MGGVTRPTDGHGAASPGSRFGSVAIHPGEGRGLVEKDRTVRHSSESWNLIVFAAVRKNREIPAFAGMTPGG
jgi:hypothetical protein